MIYDVLLYVCFDIGVFEVVELVDGVEMLVEN